ncbi:MAG: tol-pal system protein YbgF [Deltaproteobacteria bacterium]|nr:tol-pal system protein YbgF [Deltaproteobacteria bacterium]
MQFTQVMKRSFLAICLCLPIAACSGSRTETELRASLEDLQATQEVQEIRLSLIENLVDQQTAEINALKKTRGGKVAPAAGSPPSRPSSAGAAAKPQEPVVATTVKTSAGSSQNTGQAALAASPGPERRAYDQALTTLNAGRNQEAEKLFTDFLRQYPASSMAPNAAYWLGECFYSQRRYSEAILSFQSVVAQYPQHDKAAAALLKAGYSYERLADTRNARFYLQQLVELYPKSQPAGLAWTALGRLPQN